MLGSRELWLAGLTVLLVSLLYAGISGLGGVPEASGLIGHSLGILGFTLMIATETLYSLRKRAIRRPWGRMSEWLRFHIFTGIVGPYLVLLHSAWNFHGLAGLVMLLTVVVVLSGFTGRYIYTAVPRTADGIMLEAEALEAELALLDSSLGTDQATAGQQAAASGSAASWILSRALVDLRDRWQTRRAARGLDPAARERLEQRAAALRRRRQLERQISSLATARRMLALWHTVHIPIGMALFVAAFAHAAGALYYATLMR